MKDKTPPRSLLIDAALSAIHKTGAYDVNRERDKVFPAGTLLNDVMAGVRDAHPRPEFDEEAFKLLPHAKKLESIESTKKELRSAERELYATKFMKAIMVDLIEAWDVRKDAIDAFVRVEMQSNDCSRLHKLAEAFLRDEVGWMSEELELLPAKVRPFVPPNMRCIVVSQDWARLIDEKELTGDYQLPFENCAFEFRIKGRTVICMVQEEESGEKFIAVFYESKEGHWLNISRLGRAYWARKIQAICVMLEAEVAIREVKRVPYKLQAKRASTGKLPMYDFHTLSLAKRFRAGKGAPGTQTGAHKRLHFVRGHWRHYEDHKTWIKWHLRGDETLGFSDKNYKV